MNTKAAAKPSVSPAATAWPEHAEPDSPTIETAVTTRRSDRPTMRCESPADHCIRSDTPHPKPPGCSASAAPPPTAPSPAARSPPSASADGSSSPPPSGTPCSAGPTNPPHDPPSPPPTKVCADPSHGDGARSWVEPTGVAASVRGGVRMPAVWTSLGSPPVLSSASGGVAVFDPRLTSEYERQAGLRGEIGREPAVEH